MFAFRISPVQFMTPKKGVLVFAIALTTAAPISAQVNRTITKLAEGVYAIRHRDTGDGFGGGNTTVIIGTRQVFVVDSSFLPSDAREDIADIRKWTDKSVSFLLNTHFHNDHNFGNRAYMDAFPALTIIAHAETKKDMDLFGPGSASREEKGNVQYQQMLDRGKNNDGTALSEAEKSDIKNILAKRIPVVEELKKVKFQSATLTFDHDFALDIGDREVQIKFLGRGNTSGDAVVYLPGEKIAIAGDLVVWPLPYLDDGYPSEWIHTLQGLAQLDAATFVPGHGRMLHDKTYIYLLRDFFQSAVDQTNKALMSTGPAMFHTVDDVKGQIDLSQFRERFANGNKSIAAAFDETITNVTKLVFREASLR
jgi:glyoxylase-like metal-dependent hydrolase (beta-lactamase superfamily II)